MAEILFSDHSAAAAAASAFKKHTTTTLNMRLKKQTVGKPSSHSLYNFEVHLAFHIRFVMDFHPVLDYVEEEKFETRRYTYQCQLTAQDQISLRTIVRAVTRIMCSELGLKHLNKNRLLKIALFIESNKTRWIDGTEALAVVADVDVCDTYVFVNILTSDALVRAKKDRKAGLGSTTDECCTVCLEDLFAFVDQGGDDVYVTRCSHMFHCRCIGKWLTESNNCPICRFKLSDHMIYSSATYSFF